MPWVEALNTITDATRDAAALHWLKIKLEKITRHGPPQVSNFRFMPDMPASAQRSNVAASSPSCGWTATPMLTVSVTALPPRLNGSAMACRSLSRAISITPGFAMLKSGMVNSSPPMRATVSDSRTQPTNLGAICCRT